MSDLKLVADQATPLERLLLDAAANETPSAEQRGRVRAALGLSAMAQPPPVAPAAKVGRVATLGKVALGGTVVASTIFAFMLSGVLRKPASAPDAAALLAPPSTSVVEPHVQAPAAAEPVVSPLPPVEAASERARSTASAKPSSKSVSSVSKAPAPADGAADSGEQLRLIDAARTAVAAGQPGAASQALSSYNAKFPRGSFGQEAAVLRIETADLQGNHTQATSLAKSFLAQHPNSPHVSLVQRIANRGQ